MERQLRHWGAFEVVRELGGGNRNRAVLVRHGHELLVAKTTIRSEAQVRWVYDVQDVARQVGFIVPEYVATNDGRLVAGKLTLERWVQGERPRDCDRQAIGALIREFHERTRGHTQRPGFASCVDLLNRSQGGDVDLGTMPGDLVQACRNRWREIETQPQSVVHGDLSVDNIVKMRDGSLALIDWDEARVDASLLDLAGLFSSNPGYADTEWAAAKRALDAWEVAVSWLREPEYARRRAEVLLSNGTDT